MSMALQSAIWDNGDPELNGSKLNVLLCLADHSNDDGVCWPSVDRLARRARISRRETQYILRQLESDGYLTVQQIPGRANSYIVKAQRAVVQAIAPVQSTAHVQRAASTRATHCAPPVQPIAHEPSCESSCEPSVLSASAQKLFQDGEIAENKTAQPITAESDKPKRKKSEPKPRDPLLDHPAIIAYRDVCKRTPGELQRAAIAAKVSEYDPDVAHWKGVLSIWMLRGWNAGNVLGQLEAYQHGFSDGSGKRAAPQPEQRASPTSERPDPPAQVRLRELRQQEAAKGGVQVREA